MNTVIQQLYMQIEYKKSNNQFINTYTSIVTLARPTMILKVFFMLYLFHLKATTEIQTISTTATDQGSTFGMYIHFTFFNFLTIIRTVG